MLACLKILSGMTLITLVACGGSSGSDNTELETTVGPEPSDPGVPRLTLIAAKGFTFDWVDVRDASFYRLMENPDGLSGFSQVGSDIPQGIETTTIIVPLYQRFNAQYILQSCDAGGCTDSDTVSIAGTLTESIGYIKAGNADTEDFFGFSMALSGDGDTLAVGAFGEDSNAIGVNGDESDNSNSRAGAVYIYTRSGTNWNQQVYLKASNNDNSGQFGYSVSLSNDGNNLAVGATFDNSNATGANGDQFDNSSFRSGAVYVFTRSGTTWNQQSYLKASNTDSSDSFGFSVALSGDGATLAVGANDEESIATGVNSDQSDNSIMHAGAVYVFVRSGITWSQQAYLKASNTDEFDNFGWAVGLSSDGNTLAISAYLERSNATGVNGDQSDDSLFFAGAVYMFTRTGTVWSQQAYLKASNTARDQRFGRALSLSGDGATLAVGALEEKSGSTGIDGDESDISIIEAGAVYVFTRTSNVWSQQAYIKASNTDSGDLFGSSVNLSSNGDTLAVGATGEDSNATGVNGDESNDFSPAYGAVYVFSRTGTIWSQLAYIKASNAGSRDVFGRSVSLSDDGMVLAVSATGEDGDGINGNMSDNSLNDAGAAYIY